MITDKEKIAVYDLFMESFEKFVNNYEGTNEQAINDISDVTFDYGFIDELIWYFAWKCYGIETPFYNKFLEEKR